MSKIQEVADAVERGKAKLTAGLVREALNEGYDPTEILNKGMVGAMGVIGERFKNNEIFVTEMLAAARAMKKGVEVLRPHLTAGRAASAGKIILGTVSGDLHDIGKNLVGMMIESVGFEVIDLGIDVPMATRDLGATGTINFILLPDRLPAWEVQRLRGPSNISLGKIILTACCPRAGW